MTCWFLKGTTRTGSWFVGVSNLTWSVAAVGDSGGDGHADIMWKNTDGSITIWLLDVTSVLGGGFVGQVTDRTWDVAGPR